MRATAFVAGIALCLAAGCASSAPRSSASTSAPVSGLSASTTTSLTSSRTTSTTAVATTTTVARAAPLAGKTIALDPGHNGGPVPPGTVYIGNGMRLPCDTSGTANPNGLSEASLVLDVALRVRAQLEALGASVLMTRTTDNGSGPCVDRRVQMANAAHVDVGLSIHADGTTGPANASGFHIAVPVLIAGQSRQVVDASLRFALALRDAYAGATGLPSSNYLGRDAIDPRPDLANTNLPNHPRVLLELGVLNNTAAGGHTDLAVLGTEQGHEAMAQGIVSGIEHFLLP